MKRATLSFSCKIHFIDSRLAEYLRVKAFAFDKNLNFVSAKPCSLCRGILASFGFLVLQSSTKTNQTLNCLIEHLEEEEFEG